MSSLEGDSAIGKVDVGNNNGAFVVTICCFSWVNDSNAKIYYCR